MFRRILVAWSHASPPARSLAVARSLAEAYGAEALAVCCLGGGAAEARAMAGEGVSVDTVAAAHADREFLRYAHEHAFDLLVLGRARVDDPLPRRVLDWASLPVLVVAEDAQ